MRGDNMGSKNGLLPRWYSFSGNIKLIVQKLRDIIPEIKPIQGIHQNIPSGTISS